MLHCDTCQGKFFYRVVVIYLHGELKVETARVKKELPGQQSCLGLEMDSKSYHQLNLNDDPQSVKYSKSKVTLILIIV